MPFCPTFYEVQTFIYFLGEIASLINFIPFIGKYSEISRAGFCKLVLLSSLAKEKCYGSSSQEQVTDEETPTEEGLGLQMPKVPGLPEDVDKVALSSSSSSSS